MTSNKLRKNQPTRKWWGDVKAKDVLLFREAVRNFRRRSKNIEIAISELDLAWDNVSRSVRNIKDAIQDNPLLDDLEFVESTYRDVFDSFEREEELLGICNVLESVVQSIETIDVDDFKVEEF